MSTAEEALSDVPAVARGEPIPGETGIASLVPFGLHQVEPRHVREAFRIAWDNRDNVGYAWQILRHGVCDGCSLGPRGLRDDVLPGLHLCTSRLQRLRNDTIGPFAPADVADIDRLRRMDDRALRLLGRVPYPFVYRPGDKGFSRIGWAEAIDLIADRLREIPNERQAYFATPEGITNETYYVFTKLARLMGTNNVDFCGRLCHQATVTGLGRTIGVDAPTVSLSDLIGTDLVVLWGTNLANDQPVSVKYLAKAKEERARIVVVNPVREKGLERSWFPSDVGSTLFGTRLMDDFVQIRAGGDIALMNAVLKLLVEWGAVDRAFIDAHTTGWEDLVAALDQQPMVDLLGLAGVRFNELEWLARLIARARTMVTVYGMGLTQHHFGTQNVMGVVDLHLSQGAIGRPKAGILPMGEHSGVQGGGECGVSSGAFPGGREVSEQTAREMSELWGHPVPHAPGLSTGPMLKAAHEGQIDSLYDTGGNLYATLPDPAAVASAVQPIGLRVHQDTHIDPSTLIEPGEMVILLPAQTRYEQRGGGTSTSVERRIRFSPEIPGHARIGEAKPGYEIPALIAKAVDPELSDAFDYHDSQDVRDEMGHTIPVYAGIEKLHAEGDWL